MRGPDDETVLCLDYGSNANLQYDKTAQESVHTHTQVHVKLDEI